MDLFTRQFRPADISSKEKRLCHMPNPLEPAGRMLGEGFNKLSAGVASTFESMRSGSATFANNMLNVYRLDPRTEDQKNGQLLAVAEFARTAPPTLQKLIEELFRAGEYPTLNEMALIYSQDAWMDLFSNPNNFFELSLPLTAKSTLREGPKGVFASMDAEHRKLFYFEYVSGIIPLAVRDSPSFAQYFGTGEKGPRANEMVKHLGEINGAMGMMLGIQSPSANPDDPSFIIAKEGLMHQYWRYGMRVVENPDGTVTKLPFALNATTRDAAGRPIDLGNGLKPQFMQDVERVVGNDLFMGSPNDIRRRLGPSFLKGALDPAFGVMEPDDLPELQAYIGNRTADKQTNRLQTTVNVRARTNVIRREQMRNAETLGQTFDNMSGIEKIALLAIAGFALTSKKVRTGATALGALYFAQKFLLKQKDPLNEVWMPMIQGLTGKVTDFVRPTFKKLGAEFDHQKYTDEEMQRRIGIMDNFLTDNARMELNTSVEGFTILSDMTMEELSQFFTMSSDGTLAAIRYWDPNFKRIIKDKITKHGLDPASAERFFGGANPEVIADPRIRAQFEEQMLNRHVREAGDGLSTVFYMSAVREPKNKVALRIIEYFRGTMGYGSYQDLPVGAHYAEYLDEGGERRRELVYPRDLYVQLVLEGQSLASGNKTTLLEFVSSELGVDNDPVKLARAPAPARVVPAAPTG